MSVPVFPDLAIRIMAADEHIHPLEGLVFQKLFYEVFTYGTGCANNESFHQIVSFGLYFKASEGHPSRL